MPETGHGIGIGMSYDSLDMFRFLLHGDAGYTQYAL